MFNFIINVPDGPYPRLLRKVFILTDGFDY